jgi:hypothetical protein
VLFLVLLKTDNERGSVVVACTGLQQDPMFPTHVILENVQALSWPFHGRFLEVQQWSVDKSVIINWMVGPLKQAPDLTPDLLEGKEQDIPWPPKSKPSRDLGDAEALREAGATAPQPEEPPPPADPPATTQPTRKARLLSPITMLGG